MMKNILVVDNNPMMLEFMQVILSEEGYVVTTVNSGLEALDFIKTSLPEALPHIIFVDLVMPHIGGEQLCRLLRREEKVKHSHIVIVSAIAAEEENLDFSEIADAYLAKMPFKHMKEHLFTLLEDFSKGNIDHYKNRIIGIDRIYKRDITRELLFSKQHMENLLSSISDGFIEIGPNNKIIFANRAAAEIFNREADDLMTVAFPDLFSPENRLPVKEALENVKSREVVLGEEPPLKKEGDRYLRLKFNIVSYNDYQSIVVMVQDISSRMRAEQIIRDDLHEKETLLKEVHHRVKNNLNVIASLLNLQTLFITDEDIKKHLTDSKNRVESMAMIHEKLYHTENLSGVYLDSYISDLVSHLIDTYNISGTPVQTYFEIPELQINLSMAVPVGLIVNELVTNCLEHGLKQRTDGKITVRFFDHDGRYCLSIRDNGCGLPQGFSLESSESLGLLLVSNLARQINADFELRSEDGVHALVCIDKSTALAEK